MSDTVILGKTAPITPTAIKAFPATEMPLSRTPDYASMEIGFSEASQLVDDIVLKKYLHKLSEFEVVPLDDSLKQISDIRIFKITEMVYQNNEYSTYKFASVFNAVQNLNCGIFIIADSDGQKTDFYMGVRSLDDKRTTKSLKDTLRNALAGQFPGVKTQDLLDSAAEELLEKFPAKNIAAVSCVAKNKDEDFKDNDTFIQGLEKLAFAMQGQAYTAIVLAKSIPAEQLEETRRAYESIYTQLSPFANMQLSYGTNKALSISDALSHGTTTGKSYSKNTSVQTGSSDTKGVSESQSTSKADTLGTFAKSIGSVALGIASLATAPLTGGLSLAAASAITIGHAGLGAINPKTDTKGISRTETHTENRSETQGETYGNSESYSDSATKTKGVTTGASNSTQLTMQNKSLMDILEKIDLQLKRMDDCESIGMWECAAYFLSEFQETAEMAASTYKALMRGEKSGVETSAINFWGRWNQKQLPVIREYITNFIHPVFRYQNINDTISVTASSLVSSNELAIQMGLPRKSVCGFPVINHAEFGKEVISYKQFDSSKGIVLGTVFSMGKETGTKVNLDCNSLAMHTFITGSTGSGKSNTVYEILDQLHSQHSIPFLVVEPAKGEYKNVFGQFADVSVYGTNPKKTTLFTINPFRFPSDVHVLEHLDRLVEIFNVCWPMYAAMPAILKEAMEKAYVAAGWNLSTSENPAGNKFPNFADLSEQIECVINDSRYSADSKGDYSGALLTRVRSLTNGLNSLIFCKDDLKDSDLFDKNVIVDLSRVGSSETKSLIIGLLIMRLNEYRMSSGRINSPLKHVTVLEEAHNLLKRSSTEQISEGANLLGKSVELLANSIAEMRTYGEGFIIADQSPGLLDLSVIRNTNTKIILRLPEKNDRELVGYGAGLKEEQIEELAKLKRGVAAVYQNDWIEPVLVQINKCGINESVFQLKEKKKTIDPNIVRFQLVNFLMQGRVNERLEFDLSVIEQGLDFLCLSSSNRDFVEAQIEEYKAEKKLELWKDENFRKLARRMTEILGVRNRVENSVISAADNMELTDKLAEIVRQSCPEASKEKILALSQCFMKDMSMRQDEAETRQKLYMQWVDSVRERRGNL